MGPARQAEAREKALRSGEWLREVNALGKWGLAISKIYPSLEISEEKMGEKESKFMEILGY